MAGKLQFILVVVLVVLLIVAGALVRIVLHGSWWIVAGSGVVVFAVCWVAYLCYQALHPDWWPPWDDGLPRHTRMMNVFVPVAICYVMVLVLVPIYLHARRLSRETDSHSNLKRFVTAALNYAADHNGYLPRKMGPYSLDQALARYTDMADYPLDHQAGRRYGANLALAGSCVDGAAQPGKIILLYDLARGSDGKRTVAFLDGSVRRVDGATWEALSQRRFDGIGASGDGRALIPI